MKALSNENLIKLVSHFECEGFEIRIVGGAVRDFLSGLEPNDIDLCTNATPDEMLVIAAKFGLHLIPTGLQHGTVTFVIGGEHFEVTTLRIDVETDGRHAQVEFTRDFEQDAARRDFTVNAMSMDMQGNIFDYFGGKHDLMYGTFCFVGNPEERIREDFLRVLRYYRFSARGNRNFFEYEDLFKQSWVSEGIKGLSVERIWSELKKILIAPNAALVVKSMIDTKILSLLNQTLWMHTDGYWFSTRDRFLNTDLARRIEGLDELIPAAMMALLVDDDETPTKFKFSTRETKMFRMMRRNFYTVPTEPLIEYDNVAAFEVTPDLEAMFHYSVLDGREPSMEVIASAFLSGHTQTSVVILENLFFGNDDVRFSEDRVPFTITGNDLMARGMKPGPQMGQLIKILQNVWFRSSCKATKKELLEWIKLDLSEIGILQKTISMLGVDDDTFYKLNRGIDRVRSEMDKECPSYRRLDILIVQDATSNIHFFSVFEKLSQAVEVRIAKTFW